MNKDMKDTIIARFDRVSEKNENVFTDNFLKSLTAVTNALDNV